MKVEILHEDKDIIVCVKPYGMPVQGDKTRDTDLLSFLKHHIFEEEEMDEEPYLAMVHRLDRPVGGVMVFARNQQAAANLSDQIQDGIMLKFYQAILTGELPNEYGMLEDYLLKDGKTNTSKIVKAGTKGAKRARLGYELLDMFETDEGVLSYVLIELLTGRHHQIRVQMAGRGAGIYGDTKYNPLFAKTKKTYQQIALYATRLEFDHPSTGEHMVFKREPEGDVFDVIELDEY
ncbi:MAG: RluA family pseudouridine synthase [Bacteroidales bacterium]|nr:RluA family pseudouridine synthase [Clostridium sp.]MCM1204349.1 RluA family pseudouridine synthase [Bacteroidales bacterium]